MFAMTEKGHGSNVRGIQTEATFDLDKQVKNLFPVSWFTATGDLYRPSHLPELGFTPLACALVEKPGLRTASDCFRDGHELSL